MSRINTNVSAMVAQHNLAKSNTDLKTRLERLSTGLQINRGADNPAGLIVSERLRSEIAGINQAVSNAERAANVIGTAEAALSEVSDLLTSIKGLTIEAANTGGFSKEEIDANQLQIDSAIESITRIANTTSFAGLKLLNGSLDYTLSGVDSADITDVRVFGANFGTASSVPVTVEVLNSATNAQLYLSGGSATPSLAVGTTIEIRGNLGVESIQIASGSTFSAIADAINNIASVTGVSASIYNTSGLVLTSQSFGSDAFVRVKAVSGGPFQTLDALDGGDAGDTRGQDVLALINGNLALGRGKNVSLRSSQLNIEMTLTTAAAQTLTAGTPMTFSVTGGGATFQLGPQVNAQQQVGFGFQSVNASGLGNSTVGFLNSVSSNGSNSLVNGETKAASEIIDAAILQVSQLRGRLGAFQRNTLETASRSQQIALENLTSSESQIRDTDFASETSKLTRAQVLNQAGTSVLALANSSAQNVLRLLS